jgi:hypothetical protein
MGGGIYGIGPNLLVRAQQISNPLTALYLLIVIRFLAVKRSSFLGIRSLETARLSARAEAFWRKLFDRLNALQATGAMKIALAIIGISAIIRILNAYFSFGFFSGDDVEIQEMSFARLFHWDWTAWGLRSPLYPMVFIYPVQFLLSAAKVQNPSILILAGRLVVVAFSVLNLWLVYKIASRVFSSLPIGLLSLAFFAMSKLPTAFASTELPRTVASSFILLSFWLLLSEKTRAVYLVLSGISLGVAAALRFSEVVFFVPAVLFLALNGRWRQGLLLGFISVSTFLAVLGVSDALYWKSPWYSLRNIIDYTVVNKLSSRGYEPPYYYALSIGIWSDFLTVGLSCFALKLRNKKIYLWAFMPIIILSFLPHKEPRYLVPTLPFIAVMAGLSAWRLLERYRGQASGISIAKKQAPLLIALSIVTFGTILLSHKDYRFAAIAIPLLLLLVLASGRLKYSSAANHAGRLRISAAHLGLIMILIVGFMVALEIDGFRLRRSDSAVEMARYLARQPDIQSLAIEQLWKAGGRLYLWKKRKIVDIDPALIRDQEHILQEILKEGIQAVGLRAGHLESLGYESRLLSQGFREVLFSKKRRYDAYRLFLKTN